MPPADADPSQIVPVYPDDVATPSARHVAELCEREKRQREPDEDVRQLKTCQSAAQQAIEGELLMRLDLGGDPNEAAYFVWEVTQAICRNAPEVESFKAVPPKVWRAAGVNAVRRDFRKRYQRSRSDAELSEGASLVMPDTAASLLSDLPLARALKPLGATPEHCRRIADIIDRVDEPYPAGVPKVFNNLASEVAAAAVVIVDDETRRDIHQKTRDTQRKQLERHPVFKAVIAVIRQRLELLETFRDE